MDFNRNQYFLAGLVLLFMGTEIRMVDTFVLNERSTQFLAKRIQQMKSSQAGSSMPTLVSAQMPTGKHPLKRPKWAGYSLLSIGGVLVLYSLALKKPGG